MARELGVCWDTVMAAVAEHGEPLVDDPERVGEVRQLGVDETTWLTATKDHPTLFATGIVDLERRIVIEVVPGNSAADLGCWLDSRPESWRNGIRVVATDLAESYPAALDGRLDHAIRVADPFHVVRLANRCLDQVRRRVQQQTLRHRGRKRDPLYRIRKLMVSGAGRLEGPGLERMLLGIRVGDPKTRCSEPGWRRSRCATSTWPAASPTRSSCSTRRSPGAEKTRSPRSARSGGPSAAGAPRSSTATEPAPPTAPPKGSPCW